MAWFAMGWCVVGLDGPCSIVVSLLKSVCKLRIEQGVGWIETLDLVMLIPSSRLVRSLNKVILTS